MPESLLLGRIVSMMQAAIRMTVPILLAALGEASAERAGVLNIGIEGTILIGAFAGFAGAAIYGNPWAGIALAVVAGFLTAVLFALFCVTFRADQIVVGLALNIMALGLTGFMHRRLFTQVSVPVSTVTTLANVKIPLLGDIPFLGPILFNQNILVYFALLLVPIMWTILYKTSAGITIISTGEHPKAADSLGINVFKVRFLAIIVCGILAALGGAFLSVAHSNTFIEGMSAGRGYIALAVVILGKWNPWGVLWGSLLFGGANSLQLLIQSTGNKISYDLVLMIPYVATVIAVISVSKRRVGSPSALGVPYKKS